jgi:hybrid cluster-associated redox disulfide protein
MKITRKTKLTEVLQKNPRAVEILINAGMHCIGCPMAMQETLEQGCVAHGINDKEIEKLLDKLNKNHKES